MTDKFVKTCPYCGGSEMTECIQGGYGAISSATNCFKTASLHHVICTRCGSVVRSYVKDVNKLLKKSERKNWSN